MSNLLQIFTQREINSLIHTAEKLESELLWRDSMEQHLKNDDKCLSHRPPHRTLTFLAKDAEQISLKSHLEKFENEK